VGSNNTYEKRINPFASYQFSRNAILFAKKNLRGANMIFSLFHLLTFKLFYFESIYILYYKNYKAAISYLLGCVDGVKKIITRK
jgi:hypothetical protein